MNSFDDESDFDFDMSSMLGMSSVMNKDETDNSINLKALEKDLFKSDTFGFADDDDNNYNNSEFNNQEESMVYDPVKEYNNIINSEGKPNTGYNGNISVRDDPTMDYNYMNNESSEPASYEDKITDEQTSQNIINSYFISSNDNNKNSYSKTNSVEPNELNNTNGSSYTNTWNYDLDQENREDMKLRLLEKIDNLKEELEDDGINLDKIPTVDFSSKLEEIENTAKLLMLKATRNRYSNMGEEFILAISNGLEILCNGKREFFGVRPDLTNCTDIVKVKLRRVKNETSQIVADVVEKYEIPPLFTVFIELVPALFLHSQRRSRQKKIGMGLFNSNDDIDLSDDINEIRKYN
jgi:hypothetical protein